MRGRKRRRVSMLSTIVTMRAKLHSRMRDGAKPSDSLHDLRGMLEYNCYKSTKFRSKKAK